jgi:hypothetical protein
VDHNSPPFPIPDVTKFSEKRAKVPFEVLIPYLGQHVAWTPDAERIIASGNSAAEVDDKLAAMGIPTGMVVHDFIDDV